MAQATTNTDKSKWIVSVGQTATSSGSKVSVAGQTITIPTGNKYVDRDIEVSIGSVSGSVNTGTIKANAPTVSSGSASQSATGFTKSNSATNYYVTLSTTAGTAKSNAGVQTDGYVTTDKTAQSAATSVSVSGNGNKLYIPTNTISASTTALTAPRVAVSGAATGMATSTTETDYYVTVSGSGTNGSVKGVATAGSTTGIVAANNTATQSTATTITPSITGSGNKVYIKPASLANSGDEGVTYAENTSVAVPSGGALYINAGYMPNTYITLDQILDGKTDTAGTITNSKIASGYVMYDVDGVKHTGTMANVTPTVSGKTVSWSEGFVTSGSRSVADGSIKLGSTVKTGNFTVNSSASDQTITVTGGYLPGSTITVKGSSSGTSAKLGASGTASATINAATLGAVDETNWTIGISGSAPITGTATAKTTDSGYATANKTTGTGSVSGTAKFLIDMAVYSGTFTVS